MKKSSYITTLGSIIERKEPERNNIASLTEQFLNQGGKITEVSTKSPATEVALSAHNQRTARETRKRRDTFVSDIVEALTAGDIPIKIQKDLGISQPTFKRIIEENGLHSLLNQGK